MVLSANGRVLAAGGSAAGALAGGRGSGATPKDHARRTATARRRAGAARRAAARRARETRRLRALVRRDRGCLASLPPGLRRLLELRAGLGAQPSLSHAAVARRLHVSATRERRLERRALRTLRLAARDGCPVAPVAPMAPVAQIFADLSPGERAALAPWASGATAIGGPVSSASAPAPVSSTTQLREVTRAAGGVRSHPRRSASARVRDAITSPPSGSSRFLIAIALGLLAVISAALILFPLPRGRPSGTGGKAPSASHTAGPADSGAEPTPGGTGQRDAAPGDRYSKGLPRDD